jgi:hypothetical protein
MVLGTFMKRSLSAAILLAGSQLFASTYNAVTDFNSTSNLSTNTWQYGTSATLGGAFTPFVLNGSNASPAYNYWSGSGSFAGPTVGYNASGGTITVSGSPTILWPNNVLLVGPGSGNFSPYATVRFTAPAAGNFNITGAFSDLEQSSVRLYIEVGGVQDFLSSFSGSSAYQGTIPFSLSNIALTSGETVDFTVDSEGNQADDVVGLSSTIQSVTNAAVPEPSATWLVALGLLALPLVKRITLAR